MKRFLERNGNLLLGALFAAVLTVFQTNGHAYRFISGYSGQTSWATFAEQPSEDELFESALMRDPELRDATTYRSEWRAAAAKGQPLRVTRPDGRSVVMAAYDPTGDPGQTLASGEKVPGVWFTQPAGRDHYGPLVVHTVYCVGAFVLVSLPILLYDRVISWLIAAGRRSRATEEKVQGRRIGPPSREDKDRR